MGRDKAAFKLSLRVFLIILVCGFLTMSAGDVGSFVSGNNIPQPRIFYPKSENVNLAQKDNLEFKWSSLVGNSTDRRCYDFRLYKGCDVIADNLIYKKEVAPFKSSCSIETTFFQDGQIYTWTLRQVYLSGKSDRTIISFKIHK